MKRTGAAYTSKNPLEEARMNHRLPAAAAAALVISMPLATAANWISGDELERHCTAYLSDPRSTEGVVCAAFVQGYVTSAGGPSAPLEADGQDFAQRAARTRVGSRLRSVQESFAARRAYCVEHVAPAAIVEAVALHLSGSESERDGPPAREVHRALVARFPCSDP